MTCQLVQTRSRVAPIKPMTVPCLELMACNIGVRLAHSTKKGLGMKNLTTYYWSDSVRKSNLFVKGEASVPAVSIQPEETAKACFTDWVKDSGHGEGIPYANLPNAPGDPALRNSTPNDPGSGKRVIVNPTTVDGRVLKTKSERIVKQVLKD
ncbi:hypothetical protein NPIL_508841 [Nephila pilipes]|uniref:Uncharacterized protein n=1 Tax=Nephila pilipes TaxID=299642 RepID=A0A8X6ME95_NEPPI|nr:hypothetical protein NPIL_508841 [Nephila pilipes]